MASSSKNVFFKEKIALVTGANSGIGLATAHELERLGARVVRVDVHLKQVPPHIFSTDISQPEEIRALIAQVEATLGPIDLFVHAAGILVTGALLDYTLDDWQTTFAVNTLGAFYICQQIGKKMKKRSRGSMVLVGSNCATTPRLQIGAYSASKAATHQMLKCLGLELAQQGVRCNIIAPGSTNTPMQRSLWNDASYLEKVIEGNSRDYRLGIPLKKIATPQNIAHAICFLLSDQADHITMETLTVDGGATLGCA